MIGLPKWYLHTKFEVAAFREEGAAARETLLSVNCLSGRNYQLTDKVLLQEKRCATNCDLCLVITVMGTLNTRKIPLQIATVAAET